MKFAYFNPTVMAVDDVTAEQYSKLREIVNTGHEHSEHNDEGNPDISKTPDIFAAVRGDANIEFRLPVIRNPAHFVFTDQWRFKPEPLKMILFPSYIPHTVYPWKGQGSRTILAWDVKLIAK